jgi:hypothetical protein
VQVLKNRHLLDWGVCRVEPQRIGHSRSRLYGEVCISARRYHSPPRPRPLHLQQDSNRWFRFFTGNHVWTADDFGCKKAGVGVYAFNAVSLLAGFADGSCRWPLRLSRGYKYETRDKPLSDPGFTLSDCPSDSRAGSARPAGSCASSQHDWTATYCLVRIKEATTDNAPQACKLQRRTLERRTLESESRTAASATKRPGAPHGE